jgi:exopolysaccharide biosynthesis polyprenyl glycosylphosphotransferase
VEAEGLRVQELEPARPVDPPSRRFERGAPRPFRLPFPKPTPRGASARAQITEGPFDASTLRKDTLYRRLLGVADVAAALLTLFVAVPLAGSSAPGLTALFAVPLVLLTSKLTGLYDRDEHVVRKSTLDEAPSILKVATLGALAISLAGPELLSGGPSRGQVVAGWVSLLGGMLVFRAAARRAAGLLAEEEKCLVLGHADAAAWLASKLSSSSAMRARVVGRVPLEPEATTTGDSAPLGDFSTLGIVLAQHDVDRVVIAPRTCDSEHVLHAIRLVKALGVKVSVLPRLFEVVGSSVEFDEIDGVPLLGVRRYGLSRSSRKLKRALDLVGGSLLLLLLAPFMLVIAAAIKLESPGPVIFRQRRMGLGNVPFEICKFRTMVADAESRKAELMNLNEAGGGLFKIEADPRITRVGAFLRRLSLDELPQLFNVLRGEMALVGPRPLVVEEDRRVEGWQRRRLLLPPGMTGLWQVFGSARIPLQEMVKIDYLYGANWSLWLDVKILLRTVPFVLGRRGL